VRIKLASGPVLVDRAEGNLRKSLISMIISESFDLFLVERSGPNCNRAAKAKNAKDSSEKLPVQCIHRQWTMGAASNGG
jgi:hypothetical protein